MKKYVVVCFLLMNLCLVKAQTETTSQFGELPKVFVIGDFQDSYEALFSAYPDILITACNNNIDTAQAAWFTYLKEMEDYSKEIGFDLEGAAFWIHFFWTTKGEVAHVAFHLQPHSRFIKDDAMMAFLRSFAKNNSLTLRAERAYNHYGSASFPLYFTRPSARQRLIKEE